MTDRFCDFDHELICFVLPSLRSLRKSFQLGRVPARSEKAVPDRGRDLEDEAGVVSYDPKQARLRRIEVVQQFGPDAIVDEAVRLTRSSPSVAVLNTNWTKAKAVSSPSKS